MESSVYWHKLSHDFSEVGWASTGNNGVAAPNLGHPPNGLGKVMAHPHRRVEAPPGGAVRQRINRKEVDQ
jgi:hypothetical protein